MELLVLALGVLVAASMIAISMVSFAVAVKALNKVNELEKIQNVNHESNTKV